MSGSQSTDRDIWVARVLGVDVEASAAQRARASAPSLVQMQKARLVWDAARKRVASEIEQLRTAVAADFEGDEAEDDVLDGLDQLDDITSAFDDRLIDTLDLLLDERTKETERPALLKEAHDLLGEYESFASSNPVFKALDGQTPFGVTLSVNSTMTQALKGLRATLH